MNLNKLIEVNLGMMLENIGKLHAQIRKAGGRLKRFTGEYTDNEGNEFDVTVTIIPKAKKPLPAKCQSKKDGVCLLPVNTCIQCKSKPNSPF